jgi:hypothetical protein
MFDLIAAIAKAIGKADKSKEQHHIGNRVSKHMHGKRRPLDFDAKRKTRRKMARASRRINRMRM